MKKIIVVLLLVIVIMSMASCDLIGGLFVPYVGTWRIATDASRTTYTFGVDDWELLFEMKVDDVFKANTAVKGTLSVSGDTMEMVATHQKEASVTYYPEYVIGDLPNEWTEMTDAEIDENSGTGTWSVDGDEITIVDDDPEEGQNATTVLTKVE